VTQAGGVWRGLGDLAGGVREAPEAAREHVPVSVRSGKKLSRWRFPEGNGPSVLVMDIILGGRGRPPSMSPTAAKPLADQPVPNWLRSGRPFGVPNPAFRLVLLDGSVRVGDPPRKAVVSWIGASARGEVGVSDARCAGLTRQRTLLASEEVVGPGRPACSSASIIRGGAPFVVWSGARCWSLLARHPSSR